MKLLIKNPNLTTVSTTFVPDCSLSPWPHFLHPWIKDQFKL